MRNHFVRGLAGFAVAFGAFGAPNLTHARSASVSPTACNTDAPYKPTSANFWSFSVDFGDGSTDGCLMVSGLDANEVKYHPIACDVKGAVSVVNGAGKFDGTSYLSCNIDWATYMPGIKPLAVYGNSYTMKASITGLAGSSSLSFGNPLIHHTSTSLYLPRSAPGASVGKLFQTSVFNGQSYGSQSGEAAANTPIYFRSWHGCGQLNGFFFNCRVKHYLNNTLVYQAATAGPVQFDTKSQSVTIGMSPLIGERLGGMLDFAVIDPQAGKGT